MKDQLGDLYIESVRSPKSKSTAATSGSDNKKGTTGNMQVGEDFGFSKAGVQKGTGPESVKGVQKPKKAAGTLTEDTDDQPVLGSRFDMLFNQTLSEEFTPNMSHEASDDGMSSGGMGDMGDMGDDATDDGAMGASGDTGEEVSLKSELSLIVSRLQEIVDNIEGDDEEGSEDGMSGDGAGDIEGMDTSNVQQSRPPIGEASANAQGKGDPGMDMKRDGVLKKAPDFDKSFQSPTGKNTVPGTLGQKTMKGQSTGDAGMGKPRDGVLRKAPDFDKSLQSTKNNKVNTSSVMSKTGSNLFD